VADTFEADFGEQGKVAERLKKANEKIKGEGGTDEGAGKFPELEESHLVVSSAQGLHGTSSQMLHLAAGDHIALTSGEHVSFAVGKRLLASVTDGIRYFVRQAGMKFIAAADDIDLKALKDNLNLFAKLDITQTANKIVLKAKEEILLVGGGSYIKINASTIENGTSGTWVSYASEHLFKGPKSTNVTLPELPKVGEGEVELEQIYKTNKEGFKSAPYRVVDALGNEKSGTLDASGYALVAGLAKGPVKVFFGEDPRNPWDDGNYWGNYDWWPVWETSMIESVGVRNPMTKALPANVQEALEKAGGELTQKLSDMQLPEVSSLVSGTLDPKISNVLPSGGAQDLFGGVLGGGMSSLNELGDQLESLLPASVTGVFRDAVSGAQNLLGHTEQIKGLSSVVGNPAGGLQGVWQGTSLPLPSSISPSDLLIWM